MYPCVRGFVNTFKHDYRALDGLGKDVLFCHWTKKISLRLIMGKMARPS